MDFAPMGDNAEDEPTWRSHCRGPALRRGPALSRGPALGRGPAPIGSPGTQSLRTTHKRRDVLHMEVEMNTSISFPKALDPQIGISIRQNQRRKLLMLTSTGGQSRIGDSTPEPRFALKDLPRNINKSRHPKNRHRPNLRLLATKPQQSWPVGWQAKLVRTKPPTPALRAAVPSP